MYWHSRLLHICSLPVLKNKPWELHTGGEERGVCQQNKLNNPEDQLCNLIQEIISDKQAIKLFFIFSLDIHFWQPLRRKYVVSQGKPSAQLSDDNL